MSRTPYRPFITLWLIAASLIASATAQDTIKEGPEQLPAPAAPEPAVVFLWAKDNVPAITKDRANAGARYADPPDFRPNMKMFPAKEGMPVKGAVILCSGGAFAFRNNRGEGEPVARALNQLGYQCFVVNYRLRPYTQQEGALDLARAVRYVRSNARTYGIRERNIAVAGFSAGGILCGELLLHFIETRII